MKELRFINANNNINTELNNRIEALGKIYKPLRGAYSLEKMRDGKLVEDSAVYFDCIKDIVEHCSHLQHALHNKEQWYVTTPFNTESECNMLLDMEQSDEEIECDWGWEYNINLTEIANLIARRDELC